MPSVSQSAWLMRPITAEIHRMIGFSSARSMTFSSSFVDQEHHREQREVERFRIPTLSTSAAESELTISPHRSGL